MPKIIEFYLCIQMLPAKNVSGFTLAGPPCTVRLYIAYRIHGLATCSLLQVEERLLI